MDRVLAVLDGDHGSEKPGRSIGVLNSAACSLLLGAAITWRPFRPQQLSIYRERQNGAGRMLHGSHLRLLPNLGPPFATAGGPSHVRKSGPRNRTENSTGLRNTGRDDPVASAVPDLEKRRKFCHFSTTQDLLIPPDQYFQDCDTPEAYRDLVSLFEQRQPTARSV
jgi:hypothetical protein